MKQSLPVDEYIAALPVDQRAEFERILRVVVETAPSAEQGLSYGMPAFLYRGKPLISFVARRKHLSIYPFSGKVIDRLRDKLAGFDLSPGTIRCSAERPIPEPLLREIVVCRMQEIES